MYENIKIISKSEMDGIEIGMDNPDGTKCPLGTLTWYGEDDCNAEQDEAFAEKICLAYNEYDTLKASHTKLMEALGNMVTQFIKYTPQFKPEKCWEIIKAKEALSEAKISEEAK